MDFVNPRGPYEVSLPFAEAWRLAPRDKSGLVTLDLLGIAGEVRELLDHLEPIGEDPTGLDVLNERLLSMTRQARLAILPKVDSEEFNSPKGCKVSAQAGMATATVMRAFRNDWAPEILEVFDRLEAIRLKLSNLLIATVRDTWWHERPQSVRAIRYFPGEHEPQKLHVDPPVMSVVLIPPYDDRLMVQDDDSQWHRVVAGLTSKAVFLPGTAASFVVPGLRAVPHAVDRLRRGQPRDVVTLFVG